MDHVAGLDPVEIPSDVWEFPIEAGLVLARSDLVQYLFILNQSASALWYLLRRRLPFQNVVDVYSSLYSISRESAELDVRSTLSGWQQDLLARNAPPASDPRLTDLPRAPEQFLFVGDYLVQGTILRVRIVNTDLVEEIVPRLSSLAISPSKSPPTHCFDVFTYQRRVIVTCDGRPLAAEENPAAARAILLQELVRMSRSGREWLAVLHAGACGSESSCVLFAGTTHSGKTTLAAALMASDGIKLFCDDSAAVDSETRRVAPMPFSLMLREGSWFPLQSRYPALAGLPISRRNDQNVKFLPPDLDQWPSSDGFVNGIFFTTYSPGAVTDLTSITSFEALVRLRESGFWVQHTQPDIARFLAWIQSLPAYTLVYSELDQAVSIIRSKANS